MHQLRTKNAAKSTIHNNNQANSNKTIMSKLGVTPSTRVVPPESTVIEAGREQTFRVKSYVRRQGKITAGQRRALLEEAPLWLIPFNGSPLNFSSLYGNSHPVVLEIGFGMGETTQIIAQQQPNVNFLGVEVYTAGVGSLLNRIGQAKLRNIRIIQHDAVEVLDKAIEPSSLDGAHIFFPDPWHKKRHHKRRLIQPAFVELLASRLKPGGVLHCATDWQPYAEQMLEVLAACPLLCNTSQGFSLRPGDRPLTKFESRGLKLGHQVADLIFKRRLPSPPSQTAN